jgi:hypothetical protein
LPGLLRQTEEDGLDIHKPQIERATSQAKFHATVSQYRPSENKFNVSVAEVEDNDRSLLP